MRVIILAAGQGKRMRSQTPKVLHEIGGKPILFHILSKVDEALPNASVAIVLGYDHQKIESQIKQNPAFSKMDLYFVLQSEQKGTGHAARCAIESPWGVRLKENKGPVLVLPGDLPLITKELILQMCEPLSRGCSVRLLTCQLRDPSGYGRVVRRGKKGSVLRIVEEKDANIREKIIQEVSVSIYFFQSTFLNAMSQRISNKNTQGEYYLTDLIAYAVRAKKSAIDVLAWSEPNDVRGINDTWEFAQARRLLNDRTLKKWACLGVKFLDTQTTWVDVDVVLGEEVLIHPGVILMGNTEVGKKSEIGPHVVLKNVQVGEEVLFQAGTVVENSVIGNKSRLGPYAHVRPETVIGSNVKIGNFVELKKSVIGDFTSIAHLSYLGDAQVGKRVNIGCGFVTCNYDGREIDGQRKHQTIIEDDVFLGSDCQAVAPVFIGQGAYIASGSTITENVESGALAIARARQVNKLGYVKKLKEGDL